ncbi:hypothetical protein FVEG_15562 [Fusarium verticillioides 7600]|uniref:Uncharacterized protein n=1 Tax=Gibberella moniliformis (strain M3125 / FGSC 7600) TaxID=334819 RepID=W7M749_GIBM7|nr:hypothetical protein FVEG_15562 [Fusarium verticillioides 7600]EWG43375.1 hypothetical protein FVEG_15562 [Fusarium verticillioides 7600]
MLRLFYQWKHFAIEKVTFQSHHDVRLVSNSYKQPQWYTNLTRRMHIPWSTLSALKIETTPLLVNWRAVASSDCFRYGSSLHSPGQAPIDPITRLRRYTHHHEALSRESALQPRPGSCITVST